MDVPQRFGDIPVPRHRWTVAPGLTIAGDTWGDPGAPAVIMLHGVGQTRHAWRATGQTLAKAGYHAIACDARGHGDSDWSVEGDYGRDAMIRDLQAVLAQLALPAPPAYMGASMGGLVGLLGVGEGLLPGCALVLVDVAHRSERAGLGKVRNFMDGGRAGFDSLEAVAAAIAGFRPGAARSANLQGLAKNLRRSAAGRYYWHWDPRVIGRALDTVERRSAAARGLRVPTLLVRGALSDIVSDAAAREFQELCPHAENIRLDGADHMVVGDRNDRFGAMALDFLQRVVPRA